MSRVAKKPINLPAKVEVAVDGQSIAVKGPKGTLKSQLHAAVEAKCESNVVTFAPRDASTASNALAGTMRALVNNMVTGVSQGFEKKLELVGVGYRAQAQGKMLNLTLGFSHPVNFAIPEGITIETPSQTEILVKGVDRQLVGEVAAKIRNYRPPEPYKGKGVKYIEETIIRKAGKTAGK